MLAGYLEHVDGLAEYDVIVPMPTYVGRAPHRCWDHTQLIVEHAQAASPGWPFRLDVMRKRRPTPRRFRRAPKESSAAACSAQRS